VITVGVNGFKRGRVYGVRADQRFNVFYIAVVRVLGTCAGPEQPLQASTFISQFFKPIILLPKISL